MPSVAPPGRVVTVSKLGSQAAHSRGGAAHPDPRSVTTARRACPDRDVHQRQEFSRSRVAALFRRYLIHGVDVGPSGLDRRLGLHRAVEEGVELTSDILVIELDGVGVVAKVVAASRWPTRACLEQLGLRTR